MRFLTSAFLTAMLIGISVPAKASKLSSVTRRAVREAIRLDDANRLVDLLAQHKIAVDAVLEGQGYTLLHDAAAEGKLESAKKLIELGAAMNIENDYGSTPLDEAEVFGRSEVVEILRDSGAVNGNVITVRTAPSSEASMFSSGNIGFMDADFFYDPLLDAVLEGNVEEVERLLELDEDPNSASSDIGMPLMVATLSRDVAMVSLLIKHGARIDAAGYEEGVTPLMVTSLFGDAHAVKILLENGANLNIADNEGRTALAYAAQEGYVEVVKVLLEYGANPLVADIDGRTPLSLAVERGHNEVAELLRVNLANYSATGTDEIVFPM